MVVNEEDKQYEKLTNLLGGLKKVNVPANFDADLMRRINSEKYNPAEPWWRKITTPGKLVPSAALALSTIAVLFILDTNQTEIENPLLTNPRLREDVTVSGFSAGSVSNGANLTRISQNITKSGLNFRQLRLSAEERQKIEEMKSRLLQILEKSEPR